MDFLDFKLSIIKSLVLQNRKEEDIEGLEAEDGGQPESKRRIVRQKM